MRTLTSQSNGWTGVALLGAIAALSAACATGSVVTTPRPARNLPARFEALDPTMRTYPSDTLVGAGCVSPMVDPRDGYEMRFARAGGGVADYRIPDGRYGVRPGELLRVVCNTGQPIGVVAWR